MRIYDGSPRQDFEEAREKLAAADGQADVLDRVHRPVLSELGLTSFFTAWLRTPTKPARTADNGLT